MSTEDIDLSWRLLLAGWHTSYEPGALVGMEVPSDMRALWAQRRRWARGQGEVCTPLREVCAGATAGCGRGAGVHRFARRVRALVVATPVMVVNALFGDTFSIVSVALAWGIRAR